MTDKNSMNPKLHQTIDKIIEDLCERHSSDAIEEDIIALFEDIIKFFSGREEDFISFDSLTMDQKEELYNEIITIINLLRKLGTSIDKESAMTILSKNLIESLSKKSKKLGIKIENISQKEELRLKKEFSTLAIQELYKERQKRLENKKQDMDFQSLETQVKEIIKSGVKFSERVKKIDPKTRIKSSKTRPIKRD